MNSRKSKLLSRVGAFHTQRVKSRNAPLAALDHSCCRAVRADAQLEALKKAMLAVALLALLSFVFTRRLPGKPSAGEPETTLSV
jgi:hypothetical protein